MPNCSDKQFASMHIMHQISGAASLSIFFSFLKDNSFFGSALDLTFAL